MKNLLAFPSDFESINLLRNLDMLGTYSNIAVLSLNGSGQIGKDLSVVDKGSFIGITIQSEDDLENELHKCDDFLLLKSNFNLDFDREISPIIDRAIALGKKVLCNFRLPDMYWQSVFQHDNVIAPNNFSSLNRPEQLPEIINYTAIYEFETPIIFITGLNERTDKIFALLSLRRRFDELGYKVSCVTSSGCGELIGAHSYPAYMFEPINESQKIVLFNEYVKTIEQDERPDIILIAIPGAAMPYNFKNTNFFGVQNFLVSRAVPPDAVICCMNYAVIAEEYISQVTQYYETLFACQALGIIINNISYDTYLTLTSKVEFSSVQPKAVDEVLENIPLRNISVLSKFNQKGIQDLADSVINFFSTDTNPRRF